MRQPKVSRGHPQPLGARVHESGVNFSVFSEHATKVELLLFASHDDPFPEHVIELDPAVNRSFHFWHCSLEGVQAGQVYAYRVHGNNNTAADGHRFDPGKVLLDPYALGNVTNLWDRGKACEPGDNCATAMRSVVIDPGEYDWEGDEPLRIPLKDTIIYEVHVGGFTKSATSGVADPGTFRGIIEKIPHLVDLGITAVELLPIFDFDETQVLRTTADGVELRNFWGYDPYGHFAPQSDYCTSPEVGSHLDDFRDMVKALHRAGIEVILDVVFNHTSEGNENGPTISFRGLANEAYYHLVPGDRHYYMDYSGCGNTFNANHPLVTKYIVECLEYWVKAYHVDGFRFDLGSVLARGEDGSEMGTPPSLWNIELSRTLSETKLIAEAWDAGGLYEVGHFPGRRWSEWNGPYRDDIRRFVKGDPGLVGAVATRISGSPDLFGPEEELPTNSINFITCHDGFTLNDLVSYNSKHNEANGEGNRDGNDNNVSWNCGIEGPTDDPEVEALRLQQIKNFFTILMLSRGVPMILGGDEFRRTQMGNNNAYCQDSEISWFDWELVERNKDLVRFVKGIIALRKRCNVGQFEFFGPDVNPRGLAEVTWHGCHLNAPGWGDPGARALAFTLGSQGSDPDLHVLLNMHYEPLEFEVPPVPGRRWARVVDTARPSPQDLLLPGREEALDAETFTASRYSTVVFLSKPTRRSSKA